jgi:DNA mismatch repair ATPase MutS
MNQRRNLNGITNLKFEIEKSKSSIDFIEYLCGYLQDKDLRQLSERQSHCLKTSKEILIEMEIKIKNSLKLIETLEEKQ